MLDFRSILYCIGYRMNLTSSSFPFGDIIQWLDHLPATANLAEPHRQWLQADGSLTRKLQQCCRRFQVQVLGEALLPPLPAEWPYRETPLWQREVLLCLDNQPWVFARTLMPHALLMQQQALQTLGNQPLGALLFTDARCQQGAMEWGLAPPAGTIAALSTQLGNPDHSAIWGRRRHFCWQSHPLIVAEFFLPSAHLPPLATLAHHSKSSSN